jgi:DnaJ-class molecular chaperone
MFTAGAPGTDPFSGYNMSGMGQGMGGMGPDSFFQQHWQPPGSSGGWSSSNGMRGGSSAGSSPQFGGFGRQQQRQQPQPQLVSLPLSLEELYSGCTKRLKVGVEGAKHRSFVEHLRFCLHVLFDVKRRMLDVLTTVRHACVRHTAYRCSTDAEYTHYPTVMIKNTNVPLCPSLSVAVQVMRHVMDAASGKSLPVKEVLEVQVKPGWKEGTRITFAGKGDEVTPGTAADLVFVIKQQPHTCFERKGNDLHTRVKVPLVTALTGGSVSVAMPDGHSLPLPISSLPVQPESTRLVVGEGMPISKGGKGDLHITFDVVFPKQLSSQQKAQLRQILPVA